MLLVQNHMEFTAAARNQESPYYDIAFVGAGISNTFTVVEMLACLESQQTQAPRVLLIDQHPDFFKGVAYGSRSGDVGLIISRTADFLPSAHQEPFRAWLGRNRAQVFERFLTVGGRCVEDWRQKFWDKVEDGAIDDLYLPRYVFGLYFADVAERAIHRAHDMGVARCDRLVGEVVGLERGEGAFDVIVSTRKGDASTVRASRVVLGLGSAPCKRLLDRKASASADTEGLAVIDDPFEPGMSETIDRVRKVLRNESGLRGRVLIVGSNASALDVIFNLMNDAEVAAGIGRIEVQSMRGKWPELFHARPPGMRSSVECRALKELGTRVSIRADDIADAVRRDIDSARQAGRTITDDFLEISVGFNALLHRLPYDEKRRFACVTGPQIGTWRRRVGEDYWNVTSALMREGKLVLMRGRFPTDSPAGAEGQAIGAGDSAGPAGLGRLVAIINCSGSGRLTNRESCPALLASLCDRGWLRATDSGLGIRVSDDLQTDTAGIYLIGPMLTGNVIRDQPVWNMEHCGRIAEAARDLAVHLLPCKMQETRG